MAWRSIKVEDEVKEKIDDVRSAELKEGRKKSINDVIDEGIERLREDPEPEDDRDFMEIF